MSETHSERRQMILRAAKRLLKHYGIGKTTVADIARAAGVGVGTVYLEFPSKDAIIAELSGESHSCMLDVMRQEAWGSGSFADRLCALLDRRLERFLDFARDGQHGRDLVECASEAARQARARFRAAEEDLIADLLEAAHEAGEFAVTEPRQVARVLMRLHDSYAQAAAEGLEIDRVRAEIGQAHALVLNGLRTRRA
ncbi:MAG TPA: helix-turn-helix domain-containing protein [Haliangium sp.]|nr:helix-turn-helix domain-containing protein [Haliangium sp.]